MEKMRDIFTARRLLAAVCIALAAFFAALLCGSGLTLLPGSLPRQRLDLTNVTGEGITFTGDGRLVISQYGAYLDCKGLNIATKTVGVETGAPDAKHPFAVQVKSVVLGDSAALTGQFLADRVLVTPKGNTPGGVLMLRSNGKLTALRLEFAPANDDWVLESVTLNQSGFAFNWGLFAGLCAAGLLVWLVVVLRLWQREYNDENPGHRLAAALTCAACVVALFLAGFFAGKPGEHRLFWAYDPALLPAQQAEPLPDDAHYHHLFDAALNGSAALRTLPDERLVLLLNPYDPAQRGEIPYIWDMAFYRGQYYCYFMPAPLLLYGAVYLVTGYLPSPALACAVPAALAAAFLWMALRRLLLYFGIKPNLLLLLLALPALCFGSLLGLLAASADTYAQPYLWAAVGLFGAVWMFYTAAGSDGVKRRLWFLGAGLCAALVAASRPVVLAGLAAFLLPCGLRVLREKGVSTSKKALDLTAFLLPVAACAAGLLAYNQVRFGSMWDFGYAYQLTAGDMRYQTFRFSPVWLLQALRLFLLQPLGFTMHFPYITLQGWGEVFTGNRFYNYYSLGLFNLPLYLGLFFMPRTLKKADGVKRGVYIGVVAAAVLALWFDFCVSNNLYRYLCDAAFALCLVAGLVLLQRAGPRPAAKRALYGLGLAVLLVTTVVGVLLVFSNERNYILQNSPNLYTFIANSLRLR